MTYDEFMTRPLRLGMKIQHKTDEVIIKANIATRVTTSLSERVMSSPENKTELNVLRYIDAKRELQALIDEQERVKAEVCEFLYDNLSLGDADILEWKYIDGKSIQDISDIKGIAYQTAKNKLSQADKNARKKYQEVQRSTP